jgi:TatD DNase family protein
LDKYIDIHTHNLHQINSMSIINLFAHSVNPDLLHTRKYYSIGLHPWHFNEETLEVYEANILNNLVHPNIIAIGEVGLDRSIVTPLEIQKEIFFNHITISENNKLPLIIHCVKAFNDLIELRKISKSKQPWIIHGYHGNIDVTKQLLNYNFYFSYGRRLEKLNNKQLQGVEIIPQNRIFFETDDANIPVQYCYDLYSKLMKIPIDELQLTIQNNFKDCFGGT